jgi:predicted ATPase
MIQSGQTKEFVVRQEGDRVLLIYNGRLVTSLPWEAAENLARIIRVQAKNAEEFANQEQIIFDQAILTRLGVPVGLTNNPRILRVAANEAAWNSDLRRYIRPSRAKGIDSQEIFGRATIIQHAPKEQANEQ